jgi:hypothetical protein
MSKPITLAIAMATAGVAAAPVSATGAELLPPAVSHVRHFGVACCGPSGCLHVTYVFHRELRSTYGLSFDPRNFDQTEPYYHFGRVRTYPRYWVDADPVQ